MVRSPVGIHASSECLARQSTGLSQALGIRPAELHPPLNHAASRQFSSTRPKLASAGTPGRLLHPRACA